MRIRSVVCGALILALFCVPFQAGADTLTLPKDLKIINSLAYAGLKKDKVVFPDGIEFIADDAFYDAEFVGSGKPGSYAYHWCVNHGFAWESTEKTEDGKTYAKEENYSGRTTWQRFVQKYFLKATVLNNAGNAAAAFKADKVKYNIRMAFHIDEIFNKVNMQTRLNYIRIMIKGWNGPDEEDNSFQSFEKDTEGYTEIYRADWTQYGAYNVLEEMYDEQGNPVKLYDEDGNEIGVRYNHLDLRPEVWEGAVISINTENHMLSIYHPGDLSKDYHTYDLMEPYRAGHLYLNASQKNLIIDPATGQPYKKLRIKITASFNNTCRIAFHESEIDNVFVSVVDRD